MRFKCERRRFPPPRMNAIAASTSNQMATVSPQLCVEGTKYAPMSVNPTTAVMSNGTVRFMIATGSGQHPVDQKVDKGSNCRRSREAGERLGYHAGDDARRDDQLADVLTFQAAELVG